MGNPVLGLWGALVLLGGKYLGSLSKDQGRWSVNLPVTFSCGFIAATLVIIKYVATEQVQYSSKFNAVKYTTCQNI
jgi:hypothetical protein